MKRLLALTVSAVLLLVLYLQLDLDRLREVIASTDVPLLILALSLAAPIAVLTGLRFSLLTRGSHRIGVWTGTRLVLAASVLNLVLPSKLGDIAKAVFIVNERLMVPSRAFALVTFEKLIDLVSLLFWCVLGLMLLESKGWFFWLTLVSVLGGLVVLVLLLCVPRAGNLLFGLAALLLPRKLAASAAAFRVAWSELTDFVGAAPWVFAGTAAFSVGLWAVHLVQIWLFAFATGTRLPFTAAFGLVPIAILIGLVPLTFAGIGSRDAALVYLLAPWMSEAAALVLGFLCTMRYVLPALMGLPFFNSHLASVHTTGWRGAGKMESGDDVVVPDRQS